jgi:predicted nucleic acid-binding protein
MVFETAVNGDADAIVTFNRRDFEEARRDFRCEVIAPQVALEQMRRSTHEKK